MMRLTGAEKKNRYRHPSQVVQFGKSIFCEKLSTSRPITSTGNKDNDREKGQCQAVSFIRWMEGCPYSATRLCGTGSLY